MNPFHFVALMSIAGFGLLCKVAKAPFLLVVAYAVLITVLVIWKEIQVKKPSGEN